MGRVVPGGSWNPFGSAILEPCMHPVLFTIRAFELFGHRFGPIEIRAYGVMLIIGVLVAAWWARSRAKAWGIEPSQVSDAIFWGVIPGVLGARIGFIVQEWGYYSQHLDKLFSVQFAGLTSF